MVQQIVVQNLQHLHAIQNHEPGELAYVEETKEIYSWDEEKGWFKVEANTQGIDFNLYDLNKSVISQLDPMTPQQVSAKMEDIIRYFHKSDNAYHMLLCRDFNYYTIFAPDSMLSIPDFASAVCTIITELGEVYSIELLEDGAMEIWIKPNGEESPYAFYLFPYDAGVVYYG